MEDALFVTSWGAERLLMRYLKKYPNTEDYRVVRSMRKGETLGWKVRVIYSGVVHTLTEDDVEKLDAT